MADPDPRNLANVPEHSHSWRLPALGGLQQLSRALGLGGYAGIGSLQIDTIGFLNNVGPSYPLFVDFPIPSTTVKLLSAKLSFKRRAGGIGGTGLNPYKARVFQTAAQTYPDSVATRVQFDTISYDTNGNFNTALATYTAPVTGYYVAAGAIGVTVPNVPNVLQAWDARIFKNGFLQEVGQFTCFLQGATPVIINPTAAVADEFFLTAGDTVDFRFNGYGGGGSWPARTGSAVTYASIHLLSMDAPATTGLLPPSIGLLVDDVDRTAVAGGPFTADQYELDITPWLNPTPTMHTVQLTSSFGYGNLSGIIRLKHLVNATTPG